MNKQQVQELLGCSEADLPMVFHHQEQDYMLCLDGNYAPKGKAWPLYSNDPDTPTGYVNLSVLSEITSWFDTRNTVLNRDGTGNGRVLDSDVVPSRLRQCTVGLFSQVLQPMSGPYADGGEFYSTRRLAANQVLVCPLPHGWPDRPDRTTPKYWACSYEEILQLASAMDLSIPSVEQITSDSGWYTENDPVPYWLGHLNLIFEEYDFPVRVDRHGRIFPYALVESEYYLIQRTENSHLGDDCPVYEHIDYLTYLDTYAPDGDEGYYLDSECWVDVSSDSFWAYGDTHTMVSREYYPNDVVGECINCEADHVYGGWEDSNCCSEDCYNEYHGYYDDDDEDCEGETTRINSYGGGDDSVLRYRYSKDIDHPLIDYTIGFEIEKNEVNGYRESGNPVPIQPFFAFWETDSSCGVEGISHVYSLGDPEPFYSDVLSSDLLNEPHDSRCGGHVTIGGPAINMDSCRHYSGLLFALYRKRMNNTYCNYGKKVGIYTGERRSVVRERQTNRVEFRLLTRVKNQKQVIWRYRLFQIMVHAMHYERSFRWFLDRSRPLLTEVYGTREKLWEVLHFAKAFDKWLNEGIVHPDIKEFIS